MTFYAVELDICPAFGWQGGPTGDTEIKTQRNQHERRNAKADQERHYYNLPFANITDEAYLENLKNFFMVMKARTHSFLVKDHLDYDADHESLGVAPSGSTPVQLRKGYHVRDASGSIVASVYRDITHPVVGAVVYQNGVPKGGTFDYTTGLFTPTSSWTPGAALTWSGEFRVAVRFNSDAMPMTIDSRSASRKLINGSVELVEVFGE